MTGLRYLRDVVTLELDPELCTGCAVCTQVCPHGVFEMRDARAVIVDRDACIECGECEEKCPQNIPIRAQLKEAHAGMTGDAT